MAIESNIQALPTYLPSNVKLGNLTDVHNVDIHLILVDHKEFISLKNLNTCYTVDTKGIR